jgi:CRP-like cAMP-binding protein
MNADDREKTCLPLLAELPLFRGLAQEPLRFIAGGCHQRTAPKGLVVCEKGSQLDGFFFVMSGRIKLAVLSEDGSERVLDIVLPGTSFAEAAAFLGEPCPAYAQALSESRLLYVGQQRLREAVARWSEVAVAVVGCLARQVYDLTRDLEACCLRSAAQRVASYLFRAATRDGADADGGEVVLPAAKVVVASSLDLTAETFSRELHDLVRNGIVDVERRTVRVRSLERLRLRCGVC